MRSLALYGVILSLLFCWACDEATVNPNTGNPATKNGQIYYTNVGLDTKEYRVYRINSDGTGKELVYQDASILSAPALGRLVLARLSDGAINDIALFDIKGTLINTATNVEGSRYPILSPNADKILYRIGNYDGIKQTVEIHIVNADGKNDVVLEQRAAHEHIPVFSPDGKKVAYFIKGELDAENRTRDTLVTINIDGSGRRKITDRAISINDDFESLDWSPDGTKIVCLTESVDSGYDIIVVDADDAEVQQITTDHLPKLMPVFSPDSKKIAFCSGDKVDGVPSLGVSIIGIDGSNRQNITVSTVASTMYPRWSPDGKSIVVTELNVGKPDRIAGTLKLINVESGTITTLDQTVYKAFWAKK